VRPVRSPAHEAAWRGYCDQAADASLFHHPTWCSVVERVFAHQPRHLLAWRGDQVVGVLPLLEVHSTLSGVLFVSVPYATYGGVLSSDDAAVVGLYDAAVSLASQHGARCMQLRSARAMIPGLPVDTRYAAFVRDLPADQTGLESFLPRKARAAARQARRRDGLTVRHESADLPIVWSLYTRSMRRLGSVNYPYRFFEALALAYRSRFWVTTVWSGDRPLAGTISFVQGDTVMPYFVGVDERRQSTGLFNLLYLSVMQRAVEEGLRRFDFGRSRTDNRGAVAFKTNQGFEPRRLGYQTYVPRGRTAPNLTPTNPRFTFARRVWRRLPLAVTRPLGAWLSRSIPG
jgi:FemAB-related protein (PEP-CTERM system-associated)